MVLYDDCPSLAKPFIRIILPLEATLACSFSKCSATKIKYLNQLDVVLERGIPPLSPNCCMDVAPEKRVRNGKLLSAILKNAYVIHFLAFNMISTFTGEKNLYYLPDCQTLLRNQILVLRISIELAE